MFAGVVTHTMTNLYACELLPYHVTTVKIAAIGHEHRDYCQLDARTLSLTYVTQDFSVSLSLSLFLSSYISFTLSRHVFVTAITEGIHSSGFKSMMYNGLKEVSLQKLRMEKIIKNNYGKVKLMPK